MQTAVRQVSLGFSETRYPECMHIAYLYDDERERKEVLPAFVRSGLEDDELVAYFADVDEHGLLAGALVALGVGVIAGAKPDQLAPSVSIDTYCPGGCFTPEDMLGRLRRVYERGRREGRAGARIAAEMTWALRGIPGSERLVEYEARINAMLPSAPMPVICQYDMRRFDGVVLADIVSVHPATLIQGRMILNPQYASPEELPCPRPRT